MAESKPENDASSRIETVIVMALKNEISWKMLDSILDELTPTLDKSKQVIKLLLKEMQALQSSFQKMKAECDCQKMIESADAVKDSEQECHKEVKNIEPVCQLENENNLSQDDEDMISDVPKDDASESDNEIFGNRLRSVDLKSIELVEEFKDQLYTFIGNNVETHDKAESHETDYDNQFINLNEDKQIKKRPFQCTFCQKSFQRSNNLKIH